MSLDPAIVGGVTVVAIVALAAGYSYLTGRSSSVDVDDDGENEVVFGGGDGNTSDEDGTPVAGPTDELIVEDEADIVDIDDVDATPKRVRDIGEGLTTITGIGETRAESLREAGFESASDLYYATNEDLVAVDGIGPYTVDQIRSDIGSVE